MLINNPNEGTTGCGAAYSQVIEARHEGGQPFAGLQETPTTAANPTIVLRYDGRPKMPSREKLAEAMRRSAAHRETNDRKIDRLARSFANDVNELYDAGE